MLNERRAQRMADVRRGRWRSGWEERERVRRWGRRGALQACWVAECRQLEEELMGMVSAGSGVTGESFSTLPLMAPRLSSLWNSAPPAPTQVCVCVLCLFSSDSVLCVLICLQKSDFYFGLTCRPTKT